MAYKATTIEDLLAIMKRVICPLHTLLPSGSSR